MFFNEDALFLENDEDMGVEPVTDEEIDEAVQATGGYGAVAESSDLYIAGLESSLAINESYYNIREKMMNIEYVAAMKNNKGLVSESEALMSEASNAFINTVKKIFTFIKNAIIELFKKFVNFIASLFVPNKDIFNMNPSEAWKKAGYGDKKKLKVKVMNVDDNAFIGGGLDATLNKINSTMVDSVHKMTSIASTIKGSEKEVRQQIIESYNKTAADANQIATKDKVSAFIAKDILDQTDKDGNARGTDETGSNRVLDTVEKELNFTAFAKRVKYANDYKSTINKAKAAHKGALKTCDEAIKGFESIVSKTKNAELKNAYSAGLSAAKKYANAGHKSFAKYTSIAGRYYRECMAISRRVLASGNLKEAGKKAKSLASEGFDFEAYFGI